ncbi:alpha/beta hydrolase [Nocardia amamiensis]|uniref:alpha/beta hydrolase n=1 Tax=Nocardia amamiensis TaxID=404578 RepID=UPI0033C24A97
MPFSITIPPWLEWLEWVAGADWPKGLEGDQKAAGEDLQRLARELRTRARQKAETATNSTIVAYPAGAGRDEMEKSLKEQLKAIDKLADKYDAAGQRAIDSAAEMRATKLNDIFSLAWLAAELAYALFLGPGAPFAQAGAIAATQAACRWLGGFLLRRIEAILARTALSQASREILAKVIYEIVQEAITEVFQGTSQELAVQGLNIQAGYQHGGLNWDAVGQNAWISAVAGGAGGAAGHGLHNVVSHLPGGASGLAGLGKGAITGAGAGLAGAGAAYLATGLSGGGWEFDPRMFTGGALSGVGPSMVYGYRGGSNYSGGPMGNGPGLTPNVGTMPDGTSQAPASGNGTGAGTGSGAGTGAGTGTGTNGAGTATTPAGTNGSGTGGSTSSSANGAGTAADTSGSTNGAGAAGDPAGTAQSANHAGTAGNASSGTQRADDAGINADTSGGPSTNGGVAGDTSSGAQTGGDTSTGSQRDGGTDTAAASTNGDSRGTEGPGAQQAGSADSGADARGPSDAVASQPASDPGQAAPDAGQRTPDAGQNAPDASRAPGTSRDGSVGESADTSQPGGATPSTTAQPATAPQGAPTDSAAAGATPGTSAGSVAAPGAGTVPGTAATPTGAAPNSPSTAPNISASSSSTTAGPSTASSSTTPSTSTSSSSTGAAAGPARTVGPATGPDQGRPALSQSDSPVDPRAGRAGDRDGTAPRAGGTAAQDGTQARAGAADRTAAGPLGREGAVQAQTADSEAAQARPDADADADQGVPDQTVGPEDVALVAGPIAASSSPSPDRRAADSSRGRPDPAADRRTDADSDTSGDGETSGRTPADADSDVDTAADTDSAVDTGRDADTGRDTDTYRATDTERNRRDRVRLLPEDTSPPSRAEIDDANDALRRLGDDARAEDLLHGENTDTDAARDQARRNAEWWNSLRDSATPDGELSPMQRAMVRTRPDVIGNAPGIDAVAANEANRLQIAREIKDLQSRYGLSRAERAQLRNLRATVRALARAHFRAASLPSAPPVHLVAYDSTAFSGKGRAAIAFGNIDTADHVSWHVPGIRHTVADLQSGVHIAAGQYRSSAGRVRAGESIASVAWIGYDVPSGRAQGVFTRRARSGAELLVRDIAAADAAREARGGPDAVPTNKVFAHGYGIDVAEAAGRGGRLERLAGDVVLSGMAEPYIRDGHFGDVRVHVPDGVRGLFGTVDPPVPVGDSAPPTGVPTRASHDAGRIGADLVGSVDHRPPDTAPDQDRPPAQSVNNCGELALWRAAVQTGNGSISLVEPGSVGPEGMSWHDLEVASGGEITRVVGSKKRPAHQMIADGLRYLGGDAAVLVVDEHKGKADEHGVGAHAYVMYHDKATGKIMVDDPLRGGVFEFDPDTAPDAKSTWGVFFGAEGEHLRPLADGGAGSRARGIAVGDTEPDDEEEPVEPADDLLADAVARRDALAERIRRLAESMRTAVDPAGLTPERLDDTVRDLSDRDLADEDAARLSEIADLASDYLHADAEVRDLEAARPVATPDSRTDAVPAGTDPSAGTNHTGADRDGSGTRRTGDSSSTTDSDVRQADQPRQRGDRVPPEDLTEPSGDRVLPEDLSEPGEADLAAADAALRRLGPDASATDLLHSDHPADIVAERARDLGRRNAEWWNSLRDSDIPAGQLSPMQRAMVRVHPAVIGNAPGIDAAAVDQANRLRMARELAELRSRDRLTRAERRQLRVLQATEKALAGARRRAAAVDPDLPVRVVAFDSTAFGGKGRALVAFGDIDTAQHLAWHVIGMGHTVEKLHASLDFALNEYRVTAGRLGAGERNASIAWVGYDVPAGGKLTALLQAATLRRAKAGAELLLRDIAATDAAQQHVRGSDGKPVNRVFAHSYGTALTQEAGMGGRLAGLAGDIVLSGGPGGPMRNAAQFGSDVEVYVAAASNDIFTRLGATVPGRAGRILPMLGLGLGTDPASAGFGAIRIAAELPDSRRFSGVWQRHSGYYKFADTRTGTPTEALDNFGLIGSGRGGEVSTAAHRPQAAEPGWVQRRLGARFEDPERGRVPRAGDGSTPHRVPDTVPDQRADPPDTANRVEQQHNECAPRALRWIQRLTGSAVVRLPAGEIGPPGMSADELESHAGGRLRAYGADPRLSDPHDLMAARLRLLGDGASVLVVDQYHGPADEHGVGAHAYVLTNDNGTIMVHDDSVGEPHPYPPRTSTRDLAGTWGIFYDSDGNPLDPAEGVDRAPRDGSLPWHRIGAQPAEPGYLVAPRNPETGLPDDVQVTRADHDLVRAAEDALRDRRGPTSNADSLLRPVDLEGSARTRAEENAQWWHALSFDQRRAMVVIHPEIIGNADGIPAEVKDEANRLSIRRDLDAFVERLGAHYRRHPSQLERVLAGTELDAAERRQLRNLLATQRALLRADRLAGAMHADVPTPRVHVLSYSATDFGGSGRAVVAFGDVDTASSVSWHVFGVNSGIRTMAEQLKLARNAYEMTVRTDSTVTAASIAWIGYDAPGNLAQATTTARAERGGARLARDVVSFQATRAYLAARPGGEPVPTNHLFGHRYGATTVSEAAAGARLAREIGTVTMLASPGAGRVESAAEYGADVEVYVASSSRDWVAGMGANTPGGRGRLLNVGLGVNPAIDAFGATRMAAEIPIEGSTGTKKSMLSRISLKLMGYQDPRFAAGARVHSQYYWFADEHTRTPTEALANIGRIAAGHGDTVREVEHRAAVEDPTLWQRRIASRSVDPEAGRPVRFRDGSLPRPESADVTAAPDTGALVREALALRGDGVVPADLMHRGYADDYTRARDLATENALWWDALRDSSTPDGELSPMQRAMVQAHPFEVGNADGIPAHVKDQANRLQLRRDLDALLARRPRGGSLARIFRGSDITPLERQQLKNIIATQEALNRSGGVRPGMTAPPVHLLAYDGLAYGGEGRAVVAIGNVDTAEHVAWQVPGITTTVEKLTKRLQMARDPYESMVLADPTVAVASIAWIGYDAPSGKKIWLETRTPEFAEIGGRLLARDVMAYQAARAVRAARPIDQAAAGPAATDSRPVGPPPPKIHLFGHSYGSTTTSYAAAGGRLARDVSTITLVGSPGAGPVQHASEFGIGDNVYVAKLSFDPVTGLGALMPGRHGRFLNMGLGINPSVEAFGARRIPSQFPAVGPFGRAFPAHGAYFDFVDADIGEAPESLAYFGLIATGHGDEVPQAPHRVVPEAPGALHRAGWAPKDPEGKRTPVRQDQLGSRPADGTQEHRTPRGPESEQPAPEHTDSSEVRDPASPRRVPEGRARPEIQGHRGGRGLWSENTLAGFAQAMDLGVDVIELDVGLTRDGVPVISHEQKIDGHTVRDTGPVRPSDPQFPYVGKPIRELTAEQIRTLDTAVVNKSFAGTQQAAPRGSGVPTLAEAAALASGRGVTLAVEIKTDPSWSDAEVRAVVAATVACLSGYDVPYRVLGFDWRVLTHAAELAPDVDRVALVSSRTATEAWLGVDPGVSGPGRVRGMAAQVAGPRRSPGGDIPAAARQAGATMLSPERAMVTGEFLQQAADVGMPLVPYTVNNPDEMRRLIEEGVAGIVTDHPDLLRAILVEQGFAVPESVQPRGDHGPDDPPPPPGPDNRGPDRGPNDRGPRAGGPEARRRGDADTARTDGAGEPDAARGGRTDDQADQGRSGDDRPAARAVAADVESGSTPTPRGVAGGGRGPNDLGDTQPAASDPDEPGPGDSDRGGPDAHPPHLGPALPVDPGFTEEQRRMADAALRDGGFEGPDALQRSGTRRIVDSARRRATENADWWHALTDSARPGELSPAQQALLRVYPHQIGNADGLPAQVRNDANRLAITRDLETFLARRPEGRGMWWSRTVLSADELKQLGNLVLTRNHLAQLEQQAGELPGNPPVHVLSYDATAFGGDGKVVVALGDVDTARTVNWHVPGTNTTLRSLHYQFTPLRHLYEETKRVDPDLELASIIWIGYDAPTGPINTGYVRAAFRGRAKAGGDLLLHEIAAFHATRAHAGTADPRQLTNRIFAHSYGSVTASFAGKHGRLAGLVGSIALSGSPGAGPVRSAAAFGIGAQNVYVAASWRDPVTMFGADQPGAWSRYLGTGLGLGMDPSSEEFGARRIRAEFPRSENFGNAEQVHQGYLRPSDPRTGRPTESLANFGRIAAGGGDTLPSVDHRHPPPDPGWARRRVGTAPIDVERGRYDDGTTDTRAPDVTTPPGVAHVTETGPRDCAVRSLRIVQDRTGSTAIDVDAARTVGMDGMRWQDLEAYAGGRLRAESHATIAARLLRMGNGATTLVVDEYRGVAERNNGVGAHAYVMTNDNGTILVRDPATNEVRRYQDWTPPPGVAGTWGIHYDAAGVPQHPHDLGMDDRARPASLIGEHPPGDPDAQLARARAQWTAVEEAVRAKGEPVRYERIPTGPESNAVYIVEFADGSKWVYKPTSGQTFGQIQVLPSGSVVREVARYRRDLLLGYGHVPPTIAWTGRYGAGSLQELVRVLPSSPVSAYSLAERHAVAIGVYIDADQDHNDYLTAAGDARRPRGSLVIHDGEHTAPLDTSRIGIRSSFVVDALHESLHPDPLAAARELHPDALRAVLTELGIEPEAVDGEIRRLAEIQTDGVISGREWPGRIRDVPRITAAPEPEVAPTPEPESTEPDTRADAPSLWRRLRGLFSSDSGPAPDAEVVDGTTRQRAPDETPTDTTRYRNDCAPQSLARVVDLTGSTVVRVPEAAVGPEGMTADQVENAAGGRLESFDSRDAIADRLRGMDDGATILVVEDYHGPADRHGVGAHAYVMTNQGGTIMVHDSALGFPHPYQPGQPTPDVRAVSGIVYTPDGTPTRSIDEFAPDSNARPDTGIGMSSDTDPPSRGPSAHDAQGAAPWTMTPAERALLGLGAVIRAEVLETGHFHLNEVLIVHFENGTAVYRPAAREPIPGMELPAAGPVASEVATFRLDHLLGFHQVPPTVPYDGSRGPGSLQYFVTELTEPQAPQGYSVAQRFMMAIRDAITGECDRQGSDGTAGAIAIAADNDFSFPEHPGSFVVADPDLILTDSPDARIDLPFLGTRFPYLLEMMNQPIPPEILAKVRAVTRAQAEAVLAELGHSRSAIDGALHRLASIQSRGMITAEVWAYAGPPPRRGGEGIGQADDTTLGPPDDFGAGPASVSAGRGLDSAPDPMNHTRTEESGPPDGDRGTPSAAAASVRGVLDPIDDFARCATAEEVGALLTAKHGVTAVGFDARPLPDGRVIDVEAAREFARALDDKLTKHPWLDIREARIGATDDPANFAETEYGVENGELYAKSIVLNELYAADPERSMREWAEDVAGGHHVGPENRPWYGNIVHEIGHAADYAGGLAARREAPYALLERYLLLQSQAGIQGEADIDGYEHWVREQFSRYCFDERGDLRFGEALAEAYAAVEYDDSDITEGEEVLYDLLMRHAAVPSDTPATMADLAMPESGREAVGPGGPPEGDHAAPPDGDRHHGTVGNLGEFRGDARAPGRDPMRHSVLMRQVESALRLITPEDVSWFRPPPVGPPGSMSRVRVDGYFKLPDGRPVHLRVGEVSAAAVAEYHTRPDGSAFDLTVSDRARSRDVARAVADLLVQIRLATDPAFRHPGGRFAELEVVVAHLDQSIFDPARSNLTPDYRRDFTDLLDHLGITADPVGEAAVLLAEHNPELARRIGLEYGGAVAHRPVFGLLLTESSFEDAAQAHLERLAGLLRGEYATDVLISEALALNGRMHEEQVRRVFDPIYLDPAADAARATVGRDALIEALTPLRAAINDPLPHGPRRLAAIEAAIDALRASPLITDALRGAVNWARMRQAASALAAMPDWIGGVLDRSTGQLEIRAALPSSRGTSMSLLEFLHTVDRANRGAAQHGLNVEYVVVIHDQAGGRSSVEVLSRPRPTYRLPAERNDPVLFAPRPSVPAARAGGHTVDVGVGRSAFAVELTPIQDTMGRGLILQTELPQDFADAGQRRRNLGVLDPGPLPMPGALVLFADLLTHGEVLAAGGNGGVARFYVNNVSAHYTAAQYDALAARLPRTLAPGARIEVQWDMTSERAEGGRPGDRGHIQGDLLMEAIERVLPPAVAGAFRVMEHTVFDPPGNDDYLYSIDAGASNVLNAGTMALYTPPKPDHRMVIAYEPDAGAPVAVVERATPAVDVDAILAHDRRPEALAQPTGDPATAHLPTLRQHYIAEVGRLQAVEDALRERGASDEEIARTLQNARREIGAFYKTQDYGELEHLEDQIRRRNIREYKDPLGPTVEYLREVEGLSWAQIIAGAKRPRGADLGLGRDESGGSA